MKFLPPQQLLAAPNCYKVLWKFAVVGAQVNKIVLRRPVSKPETINHEGSCGPWSASFSYLEALPSTLCILESLGYATRTLPALQSLEPSFVGLAGTELQLSYYITFRVQGLGLVMVTWNFTATHSLGSELHKAQEPAYGIMV